MHYQFLVKIFHIQYRSFWIVSNIPLMSLCSRLYSTDSPPTSMSATIRSGVVPHRHFTDGNRNKWKRRVQSEHRQQSKKKNSDKTTTKVIWSWNSLCFISYFHAQNPTKCDSVRDLKAKNNFVIRKVSECKTKWNKLFSMHRVIGCIITSLRRV